MLAVWDEWSQNSEKYQKGECATLWTKFKSDGDGEKPTIASLARRAKKNEKAKPLKSGPLPVTHPAKIAKVFIADQYTEGDRRTLVRHCGEWRYWTGTAYRPVGEENFKADTRKWLEDHERVRHKAKDGGFELIPVQANTKLTNEVIDATRAIANIPRDGRATDVVG